jgi:hypothetical protein
MNDKPIQRILQALADEAVPPETDLWPALRARITKSKGTLTMTPTLFRQPRTRLLAISTLAVLALAAGLLATPQGRALAQNVLRLFTPSAAETFTVPPELGQPLPAGAPTAEAPVFDLGGCAEANLACQVSYAESLAGFQALAPAGEITGLRFLRAVWNEAKQEIRLEYTTDGYGSHLFISARRGNTQDDRWDQVAPSAQVQAVTVAGVEGEYVAGTYVVLPGATEATWQPDASNQRLRWRVGEMVYTIEKWGDVRPVEYLDQAGLIALAESLQ